MLALDIGGTTAKCSLIENGEVKIKTDYWIERDRTSAGYPIMVPVVDLVEIGNGGGSIAWVDDFGKLHVGPQSAGAVPGPGRLWPRRHQGDDHRRQSLARPHQQGLFLRRRDRRRHESRRSGASTAVAEKLGVDADEAARGIIRIANNNMVNALKLVSLNRGHDPRDFTLVAFGGGGGMHGVGAGRRARRQEGRGAGRRLGVLGLGHDDVGPAPRLFRHAPRRSEEGRGGRHRSGVRRERGSRRKAQFAAEGVDAAKVKFLRYGKFRYQNQEHTTEVLVAGGKVTDERLAEIEAAFHETYEREYTYRLDAPVEMVGIHLVASAEVGKLTMRKREATGATADAALKGHRDVDYALEGVHSAAIYDGAKLEPGMSFTGPAIVEDSGSTIVVHPGNRGRGRRLRQHPHPSGGVRRRRCRRRSTTRSRWRSSRTRCRRPPTRCSRS